MLNETQLQTCLELLHDPDQQLKAAHMLISVCMEARSKPSIKRRPNEETTVPSLLRAETERDLLTQICCIIVKSGGERMAWVAVAEHDARKSMVVQMRFFAGLKIEEIADALNTTPRTIERDWCYARAWLFRELSSIPDSIEPGDMNVD